MAADDDITLSLLGVGMRISVPDDAVRARVASLWQPFACTGADVPDARSLAVRTSPGGWSLHRGGDALGDAAEADSLLRLLAVAVNAQAITECPDLLVHGGCVARQDAVLAFAAPSGAGKSTLTAACAAARWEYVTDEALWVQPDGSVLPYARPLNLSSTSASLLGLDDVAGHDPDEEQVRSITDVGGQACSHRVRLTDVVLLDRRRTPVATSLQPLHPADGFITLLRLAFNHYADPEDSLARLSAAIDGAAAWRLVYSDARRAAALLSDALCGKAPRRDRASGHVEDEPR